MTFPSFPGAAGAALLVALTLLAPAAVAQTVAVTGGRVYTGTGEVFENGTVLIEGGRIVAVGADVAVPAGAERIDASGRWVTPGLFNGYTRVGLVEIGTETEEYEIDGHGVDASFHVRDALNPASQVIPPVRLDGVTTVVSGPSGGLISGQAVVIDLAGDRVDDLVIAPSAAMVAHLNADARPAGGGSRAGAVARLRRVLEDAREYERRRDDYREARIQPLSAPAADLEALLPVLRGEVPLLVTANRVSDIDAALRLAGDFGLRLLVAGGREAWVLRDDLAAARVPVVLIALDNLPSYDAPSARLDNAALLAEAGVPVVFATFDAHNAGRVRQAAGNAVAHGMEWADALRALTLGPAEAFGLAGSYGTLAPGKVANVVVWSGDPLELSTGAEAVWIRGARVPETSRQRALMERYRDLLLR